MAVRNVELGHEQLGPYFEDFVAATDIAVRHFWTRFNDDAHRLTTVARANVMRCLIADELKKLLDGRPGINIEEAQQTTTFLFQQEWLMRVHKLDEEGHTAPNDTQICLDLNDNDLNAMPGIPDAATVVYLGYIEIVADRFRPEIRLVCPDGSSPAWVIDLRGSSSAPPAPMERVSSGEDNGGTRVIVRRQERKASH